MTISDILSCHAAASCHPLWLHINCLGSNLKSVTWRVLNYDSDTVMNKQWVVSIWNWGADTFPYRRSWGRRVWNWRFPNSMWSVETTCLRPSFSESCVWVSMLKCGEPPVTRMPESHCLLLQLKVGGCAGARTRLGQAGQRWENLNFISLLSSPAGALGHWARE